MRSPPGEMGVVDQAEGLRRLLAHNQPRLLAFVGARPKVGCSTLLLQLGAAMARRGRSVMVVDEYTDGTSLTTSLAGFSRHELLDVVEQGTSLPAIMRSFTDGVSLLPAAHAARHFADMDRAADSKVRQAFSALPSMPDALLIDAQLPGEVPSFGLAGQEVVLVLEAEKAGLTEVYGLIKRLHQDFARERLHLVFNRANAAEAQTLFNTLVATARRFLDVRLNLLAVIPQDERWQQAARAGKPIVDSFPHSASAIALRELAEAIDGWPVGDDRLSQPADLADRLLFSSRLTGRVAHA